MKRFSWLVASVASQLQRTFTTSRTEGKTGPLSTCPWNHSKAANA